MLTYQSEVLGKCSVDLGCCDLSWEDLWYGRLTNWEVKSSGTEMKIWCSLYRNISIRNCRRIRQGPEGGIYYTISYMQLWFHLCDRNCIDTFQLIIPDHWYE
jgi:hypothetical protein